MTDLLPLAVATTRWPIKQKTLPPTRNQRRPSRSVLAPLGQSEHGGGALAVGYAPDHKADCDGERPRRNEPDCLCRVSKTRGDLRLNCGHDRNGPEGQAIAHGQDLPARSMICRWKAEYEDAYTDNQPRLGRNYRLELIYTDFGCFLVLVDIVGLLQRGRLAVAILR